MIVCVCVGGGGGGVEMWNADRNPLAFFRYSVQIIMFLISAQCDTVEFLQSVSHLLQRILK